MIQFNVFCISDIKNNAGYLLYLTKIVSNLNVLQYRLDTSVSSVFNAPACSATKKHWG